VNHIIGIHGKYLSSSRSPSPVYAGIFLFIIKTASKPPKPTNLEAEAAMILEYMAVNKLVANAEKTKNLKPKDIKSGQK
jgi:hypothetical protein